MGKRGKKPTGRMKPCKQCGTPFYCEPSRDDGGKWPLRLFCGRPCSVASITYTDQEFSAAFWKRVNKDGPNGCWVWTGYCQKRGHGWTTKGLAHRYSWEQLRGPLQKNDCLLHHCDNPPCVNPEHLYVGDRADNGRDCAIRGRSLRGELSHHAKLTDAKVIEIRRRYKRLGAYNQTNCRELAEEFGVSMHVIYNAATFRTWKHLGVSKQFGDGPLA